MKARDLIQISMVNNHRPTSEFLNPRHLEKYDQLLIRIASTGGKWPFCDAADPDNCMRVEDESTDQLLVLEHLHAIRRGKCPSDGRVSRHPPWQRAISWQSLGSDPRVTGRHIGLSPGRGDGTLEWRSVTDVTVTMSSCFIPPLRERKNMNSHFNCVNQWPFCVNKLDLLFLYDYLSPLFTSQHDLCAHPC